MKKLLLLTTLLVASVCSYAQWSSNPAVNTPVATKLNSESQVASVADGSGGVFTAWAEKSGSLYTIYVQRLSSAGIKLWGVDGLKVSDTPDITQFPMLASDGNGGVVVGWTESKVNEFGKDKIYTQRLSANGDRMWGANGVAVSATESIKFLTSILSDASGNVVLSWADFGTMSAKVYVQKLNSNGIAQWNANGLAVADGEGSHFGYILDDPTGGYIVLWEELIEGIENDASKVYWQKLNADGSRKTPTNTLLYDFPESTSTKSINGIVSDGNGGLYLALVEEQAAAAKLYLQHIAANASKSFASTPFGIEVDAAIGEVVSAGTVMLNYQVIMGADNDGGVIIGWTDIRSAVTGFYAQRYNSAGTKQWGASDLQLISGAVQVNGDFGFVKNSANDFVFLLTKADQTNNSLYYAHKVNSAGALQYSANGVAVATSASVKSGYLVPTGNMVVATWSDTRAGAGNEDVYAQSIFPSGVLPVDFTDFKLSYQDGKVLLNWSTASETNNSHYLVERSENGKDFLAIGSVKGAGTSTARNYYSFTDANTGLVTGTLYYRIKQVDNDGGFDYSEVKSILVTSLNNAAAITFYPNPVQNELKVSLNNPNEVINGFSIHDYSGRKISIAVTSGSSGNAQIDLRTLQTGNYVISVSTTSGVYKGKIVKE